ncbi:hypothetical protein H6P81_007309 [Aristolochia fimbriata]|uniref:Transmembrane 9 superfamily member n=1 Tax=Aristolochia fimbriata TaxID=158543 RepID=A0AAV7F215_ARIFI|nr:hypothetical protein H6P81_007309 [Aristolochia fimbriata]
MAKFNVTQKLKRTKIKERKRATQGDPETRKLKVKEQPTSLSGKRKRKLFKKWRKEQKDALQKGLISLEDVEMAVAEGSSEDTGTTSQEKSKKSPIKFHVKKGGKLRIRKLKRKGRDTSNNSKKISSEPASTSSVDAMDRDSMTRGTANEVLSALSLPHPENPTRKQEAATEIHLPLFTFYRARSGNRPSEIPGELLRVLTWGKMKTLPAFVVALCLLSALRVSADGSNHKYKEGDHVPLYANKVGPFHNPSETYRYYDLPFCTPEHVKEKREDLGEVLNGDRLVSAPYQLNFRVDRQSETLCQKTLSREEVAKLRDAVSKDYYFQMYYDDLPFWGFIGKVDKENKLDSSEFKYLLFKHIHFDILYNNDRVIEINVQTDPNLAADITEDKEVVVELSYSVKWKETDIPFEKRMEKYSKSSSMPQHLEIHWFSIINSCVTVLLLTGFLATILMRVLKNDFIKYSHDEESLDDQEETGWKYIHGDVFRFPKYKSLFCAVLGSGTQLLALAIFIFLLALVGVFYPYNRGALFTALVVIYALTSGIAGYTATSMYLQLEGTNWVRNLLLTGCLFCGPLFLTFCFLNTVAIAYSATAALPFGTILVILLIWTLVTSPLLVLGGIAGKNSKAEFQAPCRTTKYPREIPPLPWYRGTIPQMAMAGFLPFSAIYIELYYIFASVWGHKIYTIYSILFIVFIILIIVTAFITVALTYFQLAVEDHEWWWRSVLCGGSTGVFIFGYCLYYYYARSDMSGFMQTSFFFGYMACICYGFFLMLGTVGFRASLLFVRHIYRSIKCE